VGRLLRWAGQWDGDAYSRRVNEMTVSSNDAKNGHYPTQA
jgi:hypothetical protein